MNIKFRKQMALLISICLLFSTFLVDTAAGTGDAPDGSISVPAADESPEPSVTASPTPDTAEPSPDEPAVTPVVEESSEPSETPNPTLDATEPSLGEPAVTPVVETSTEPSVVTSPTPDATEPSPDDPAPTPATDGSPESAATASPTSDTTEMPPSDPGFPADTEAPLYEDETLTSSSGEEGAPPSITIDLVGGAKGSRFAGMIARSSSPFSITRGQEVELQVKSFSTIRGWRLSNTSVAEIINTSYSFVVDSTGAYNLYSVTYRGLRTGTTMLFYMNSVGTWLGLGTISVTTPVTGIELTEEILYVGIGHSVQLTATVSPADADDLTVFWKSSDDAVVSVDDNGQVSGVAEGSATISAESADGAVSASCVVYAGYLTDTLQIVDGDIALNGTDISRKLNLSFEPADATYKTVHWTSSAPGIAVVDELGVVTARGNGHATITATSIDTGASDSVDVTVSGFVGPTGIVLNASEIVLTTEGKLSSVQLAANITPANASDKSATWSVADEGIAQVDSNGVVTPVSIGTTVVTAATAGGLRTASCSVRVIKGKYNLLFLGNGTRNGDGWLFSNLGQDVNYFYGDPVVFPGPSYGYRIVQWYMDFDYNNGSLYDPVPDGFMPESDTTFYAAQEAADRVSSIRLNQSSLAVGVGQTVKTVKATVSPANAANPALNWSSSNYSVATVGANGSIRGVRKGTATITAAATDGSGKSASLTVTVVPKGVTGIKLNKTGVTMGRKQTIPLSATLSPSNASNKEIRWVSSNVSVATVSASGVVTSVQIGTAKISAIASSGLEAACTVRVMQIDPAGITISKTKASMLLGSSISLAATVVPTNAENRTVTWSSSDTTIATVDQSGKVTAKALGTATIQAKSVNNKIATCKITVKPVLVSSVALSLAKAGITIAGGESFGKKLTLSATVSPANATTSSLNWYTSNARVATVDQNGVVTSVGNGKATITAAAKDGSGKKATCTVTVAVVLSQIGISGSHEVAAGKSVTLKATVQPANAVNKKVVWSSSDNSVVKVSSSGVVTAGKAAAGRQAVITSRAADGGGAMAVFNIAVKPAVQKVSLSAPSKVINLATAPTLQLTAVNSPSTASLAVTWSTSNSKIATVSPNGLVTGLKKGTVTITAKAADGSGKKASITIVLTT